MGTFAPSWNGPTPERFRHPQEAAIDPGAIEATGSKAREGTGRERALTGAFRDVSVNAARPGKIYCSGRRVWDHGRARVQDGNFSLMWIAVAAGTIITDRPPHRGRIRAVVRVLVVDHVWNELPLRTKSISVLAAARVLQ